MTSGAPVADLLFTRDDIVANLTAVADLLG
jgi:hypothetical protein